LAGNALRGPLSVDSMRCVPLGDCAVLVEVGTVPDPSTSLAVRRLVRTLEAERISGVRDIVPAYTTVTVHYDPVQLAGQDPFAQVGAWIKERAVKAGEEGEAGAREVVVPVRYGGELGPDLARVAAYAGMTPQEVVRAHTEAVYTVEAIGFMPGFPYLSGLPRRLEVPRHATPRRRVEAGSVAIAAGQAGIYPQACPGGWNLLGRTERMLFNPAATPPAVLRVGDRVRFSAVALLGQEGSAR
jgi:KipI family sensor histidine kinase inhibitor